MNEAPVAKLKQADQYLTLGDFSSANRLFEQLYIDYGPDPNVLAGMGVASIRAGAHERAVRLLAEALLQRWVPEWAGELIEGYAKLKFALPAYVLAAAVFRTPAGQNAYAQSVSRAIAAFRQYAVDAKLPETLFAPKSAYTAEEIAAQNAVAELLSSRQDAAALSCVERLLEQYPNNPYLLQNGGVAAKRNGRLDAAERWYLSALAVDPLMDGVVGNLGNLYLARHEVEAAYTLLEVGAMVRPNDGVLWGNLSVAYNNAMTAPWEAAFVARRALQMQNGDNAGNWASLASALTRQGRVRESLSAWDEAIRRDPARRFDRLFQLQYAEDLSAEFVSEEYKAYGRSVEGGQSIEPRKTKPRKVGGVDVLNIGFVTGDLKSHPVSYFIYPLLEFLNRGKFNIKIYMTAKEDEISERFKLLGHGWENVRGLSDAELATHISNDGIDVLVDLAGHTGHNRLSVFSLRPAPMSVTWLGNPNTTGLSTVDWRITDAYLDPPGYDKLYTEKLWRMPVSACYMPLIRKPDLLQSEEYAVQSPPAVKNGYITFGCCNNLSKISDTTVALWAKILTRVPGSRLLLEAPGLHHRQFRHAVVVRFMQHGIGGDRLLLCNRDYALQYKRYNDIDIALDPFPYNGGTTTCDLLWMGVPMVTLAGHSAVSRMGVGVLTLLNETDWIASTYEHYAEIAEQLASDVKFLVAKRNNQRRKMERCILMDYALFARMFEQAVCGMWEADV